MKKIGVILLCIVLFTGCTTKKETEPTLSVTKENIQMVSHAVASALMEKQFEVAEEYFSSAAKKSVPLSRLEEAWNTTIQECTTMNGITKEIQIIEGGLNIGYEYVSFEEKEIKIYLTFDEEMKVSGINLNYAVPMPELVETDTYYEEEVRVGKEPTLNGIITMPKGIDYVPLVILVQGSGQTDMNETIEANKPFEDIAHGLAENGVASLRYDKRYYDYPETACPAGNILDCEYNFDLADAIHNAEKYNINPNNIYMLGHSEGGMLAYGTAYNHYELQGIIILAGTARSLAEVMYDQAKNAGSSESDLALIEESINLIHQLTEESPEMNLLGLPNNYWISLDKYKAESYINLVSARVLILQGEEDFQVFMDPDYALWEKLTKGKTNVVMKSYPSLNHLFMKSIHGDVSDYAVESHVDSQVMKDIADWINGKDILEEEKDKKGSSNKKKN